MMSKINGPIIDMTPDGGFIEPPKPTLGTILARLVLFAVFLGIAALMFWTALFILPFLVMLGVIAYFAGRMQMRRWR
jgi:hypothetical protein